MTADDAIHGKGIGAYGNGLSPLGSDRAEHKGEHPSAGRMAGGVTPRLGQMLVAVGGDGRLAVEGEGAHALVVILSHLVGSIVIRHEFQLRHGLCDDEIGDFPFGDASKLIADTHGVSRVEGDGIERLFRGKAIADAGHRHNELHVA